MAYRVRALTLLETVISITLITMLISALLTFFWQSVEIRDQAARIADRTQIERQVLDRMAAELRGCIGMERVGFISLQQVPQNPEEEEAADAGEFGAGEFTGTDGEEGTGESTSTVRLIGDRRSITFLTTTLPDEQLYRFFGEFDQRPPGQHDLREISYRLWIDPDDTDDHGEPLVGGIIRTEKKTLNQFLIEEDEPLQLRNDLWSHELGYLEYRYFDGVEWTTEWQVTRGNSLPQLIQITVGFDSITRAELEDQDLDQYPLDQYPLGDDRPHPDRYSTIIRIPAADKMFGSRIERVGREFTEQFGVEGGF